MMTEAEDRLKALLRSNKHGDAHTLDEYLGWARAAVAWQVMEEKSNAELIQAFQTLNPNPAMEQYPLAIEQKLRFTSKMARVLGGETF